MSIDVKVSGFDAVHNELEKLSQKVQAISGKHEIPFDDLFTSEFMSAQTNFSSFSELLEAGGFVVNSQQDFQNIPDDVFEEHIAKTTNFSSWEDMIESATQNYVVRKLGLE